MFSLMAFHLIVNEIYQSVTVTVWADMHCAPPPPPPNFYCLNMFGISLLQLFIGWHVGLTEL